MSQSSRPRRPAILGDKDAELIWGDSDPALASEAAHATASAVLLGPHRFSEDPDLAGRIGAIIDAEGLDEVAALWSRSPSSTLPGALWRLYLVRAWLQRDPETIEARFRQGAAARTPDADAEPLPPAVVDEELATLFNGTSDGNLPEVLERAAEFLRLLAAGTSTETGWVTHDDETAQPVTGRRSALTATADELEQAATLARAGRLD